jgi:hypothetical protein
MTASLRLRDRHIAEDRPPNKEAVIFCGMLEVNPNNL